MVISGSQQLVGSDLVLFVEQHRAIFDIVDVGTHLIHAIGRLDGHHIVFTGIAETTVGQIDGLVASVA